MYIFKLIHLNTHTPLLFSSSPFQPTLLSSVRVVFVQIAEAGYWMLFIARCQLSVQVWAFFPAGYFNFRFQGSDAALGGHFHIQQGSYIHIPI